MYRAARALIIKPSRNSASPAHSAPARNATLQQIVNFGITAETVHAGGKADLSAIDTLPDVLVLDVCEGNAAAAMAAYARELAASGLSRILPVVMVGAASDFSLFDVDLHLDRRTPAHVSARKIKHVIRLAAMRLEYARRIETAGFFGVRPPDPESRHPASPARLLVIGKGERYFQLATIFGGTATLKVATTFEHACDLMKTASYDCLVIDTLASGRFDIEDLKTFKLDARFFTLPVLLLQEGLAMEEQETLIETGICDLFDLHGEAREIATYVKTLINAEKTRHALLAAFKAPGFGKIRDNATGLPSRAFFERHLDRLVRQSQAWKTPIAFGVLETKPLFDAKGKAGFAQEKSVLSQIGQIIASLVRAEDIATHFGGGKFVIAAPNSTGLTVSVLIGRIGAVLRMTEFSLGADTGRVEIATSYFESRPQDSSAKIMAGLTDA